MTARLCLLATCALLTTSVARVEKGDDTVDRSCSVAWSCP